MLGESLYDSQNQLIESFVEVTAPVTFVGPTGLHLFGYDPVLGLVNANGQPIGGGGGTPGGSNGQVQYNNNNAFGGISGATTDGTALTLVAPVLGTPASGTLSNCTGFPTANLAGLGANVATFLATPSSANLASAVSDETGSGALVFANTPTLVTPVLGAATATSIALSNGGAITGDTTTAHTWSLNAYDVDGTATQKMLEFTNANTPTMNVTAPTGLQFNSLGRAVGFTNSNGTGNGPATFIGYIDSTDNSIVFGKKLSSGSDWSGIQFLVTGSNNYIISTQNGFAESGELYIRAEHITFKGGIISDANTITVDGATGKTFVSTNAASAPSTSAVFSGTDYYGGNGKLLGDPVAWILFKVGGTERKIPVYA